MKIDISHLLSRGNILNEIVNYIRFDLTKDDEIILHPENPFDFPKYVYNDGFERIIDPDDIVLTDINIFSLGECFEIFSSTMFLNYVVGIPSNRNYFRDILNTIEGLSNYEILVYRGNDPVAFIQVNYNMPQCSYIELR